MNMCQYKKGREGEELLKTWQEKWGKNIGSIASPEECSKGEKKIVYFFCMKKHSKTEEEGIIKNRKPWSYELWPGISSEVLQLEFHCQ